MHVYIHTTDTRVSDFGSTGEAGACIDGCDALVVCIDAYDLRESTEDDVVHELIEFSDKLELQHKM